MKAKECYERLSEALNYHGSMPDSMRFLLTEMAEEHALERRNAASIIHVFMRDILNVPDLDDVSPSYVLSDLYDCRVCAAAIMQVYSRGIMKALYPLQNGKYVFGGRDEFTDREFDEIKNYLK